MSRDRPVRPPVARLVAALCLAAALFQPVRAAAQDHPWAERSLPPERRAALLVGAMTQAEKFEQLTGAPGVVPEIPQCYGARHVPGVARLGIPTLRITNGPVGVGQNDCVPPGTPGLPMSSLTSRESAPATALPSAIAVAASFDTAVARRFGDVIGRESRDLALQVLEGPGLNLARVPQGGRNFEYFGEDPFLTGSMAVSEIRAIQGHGVIAMAKHFVANEQETNRFTVNEEIAPRVLRELYLLPFEMAVKDGGVAAIMCSYNSVNGPHACEDRRHLTGVLRDDWGFDGYVQSDFFAVHATAPALTAGMDHEMPGLEISRGPMQSPWFSPARLQAALDAGEIAQADIDRALARRYTQMFRLGIFDRPVAQAPIDAERDGAAAREIGEQSAVLLKNGPATPRAGGRALLPIDPKAVRSIALIGKAEYVTKAVAGCCGGSSDVIPLRTVPPLDGLRAELSAAGSSASTTLTVVDSASTNLADAVAAARAADVAIVMAGTLSEEGRDLPDIALGQGQDSMIAAVAAANPRTVVVLKDNASALLPWIDRVPAVLEAWFPGQEDGEIVARLLLGAATPSGKLPVTFPRRAADLPVRSARQWPGVDSAGAAVPVPGSMLGGVPTTVEYSEGLEMGYRWFDARKIEPLFPFGHGLSYTTFRLSDLSVTPAALDGSTPFTVRVTVENTGARRGAEVPQVYLELPRTTGEPPKRLVGFRKVWLEPGERKRVEIVVDPRASNHPLGYWDEGAGGWSIAGGEYGVYVGTSSGDTPLHARVTVRADAKGG